MKKIYTLAIMSALVANAAFAGNNMNNATITTTTFVEPVVDTIITVNQIPNMMDNQNVVMTGYIIESLGDQMYVFQDSTGTINIEIEPVVLGEMIITPDAKIKLKGEIDKGENNEPSIIEVDYITTM